MIDFLWSVLAVLVVFGTVVVVHELGHFAAAKVFRIRVEAFSVGFGPRLFGFRRGETDYKVCAIPLGGYVKMAGENPDDVTGGVEEFLSHPKWQRFIVAIMGPVMNGLLAVVLMTGLFYHRYEVPVWPREPVVVGLIKADSPALKSDLRLATESSRQAGSKTLPGNSFCSRSVSVPESPCNSRSSARDRPSP